MNNRSWIFLGLVFLILLSNKTSSQNLYHTGLLFTAAPQPKEKRTSLNLTPDSPITVRNNLVWSSILRFGIGNNLVIYSEFSTNNVIISVSYTHLRAHETDSYLVCRLLLEK